MSYFHQFYQTPLFLWFWNFPLYRQRAEPSIQAMGCVPLCVSSSALLKNEDGIHWGLKWKTDEHRLFQGWLYIFVASLSLPGCRMPSGGEEQLKVGGSCLPGSLAIQSLASMPLAFFLLWKDFIFNHFPLSDLIFTKTDSLQFSMLRKLYWLFHSTYVDWDNETCVTVSYLCY